MGAKPSIPEMRTRIELLESRRQRAVENQRDDLIEGYDNMIEDYEEMIKQKRRDE